MKKVYFSSTRNLSSTRNRINIKKIEILQHIKNHYIFTQLQTLIYPRYKHFTQYEPFKSYDCAKRHSFFNWNQCIQYQEQI